jgi:deferrochelatase/peroxidase EfeB
MAVLAAGGMLNPLDLTGFDDGTRNRKAQKPKVTRRKGESRKVNN